MFLFLALVASLPMISLQAPVAPPQEVVLPQALENISEALESVPAALESVQEALKNVPAALEQVPASVENIPAAVETVIETLEAKEPKIVSVPFVPKKVTPVAALPARVLKPKIVKTEQVPVEQRLSRPGVTVVINPNFHPDYQGYAHRAVSEEISQLTLGNALAIGMAVFSACLCVKAVTMLCCMRRNFKKMEEA